MGRRKSSQISEPLDRTALIQIAATFADQFGDVNQVTLAQLASHFGIRVPSLYNHIEGWDAIRHEVALLGARELAMDLRQAAIGKASDDAVISIAHAYREFALAHPGQYAALVRAPDPNDAEMLAEVQKIIDLLLLVLEPYQLKQDEAIHVIRALRSVVHGFVSLELAGGFGLPLDCDESFARLVQTFLDGLNSAHRPLISGKGVHPLLVSTSNNPDKADKAPSRISKRSTRKL